MTDRISKVLRSANMRAVRGVNTTPEIRVRQIAHKLGYRFRLHQRDLPGKPDISFPGLRRAIFVHGCFWHQHPRCYRATIPQANRRFWRAKFKRNADRDTEQLAAIKKRGWRAMVIWECEIKDEERLKVSLRRFLRK